MRSQPAELVGDHDHDAPRHISSMVPHSSLRSGTGSGEKLPLGRRVGAGPRAVKDGGRRAAGFGEARGRLEKPAEGREEAGGKNPSAELMWWKTVNLASCWSTRWREAAGGGAHAGG